MPILTRSRAPRAGDAPGRRLRGPALPRRARHAELVGGGTIAGRVHRDRELAAGPIVVRARCTEAWREAPPRVPIVPANRSMRMPRWHERTLWSEELVLDGLVRGALGRLRVHAAARSAARRRGALGGLALRDRGAPPAAPAPGRARARRAARLPRDAARARTARAAAPRVRPDVHRAAAVGFDRAAGRLRARPGGLPAPRQSRRSSPRRARRPDERCSSSAPARASSRASSSAAARA